MLKQSWPSPVTLDTRTYTQARENHLNHLNLEDSSTIKSQLGMESVSPKIKMHYPSNKKNILVQFMMLTAMNMEKNIITNKKSKPQLLQSQSQTLTRYMPRQQREQTKGIKSQEGRLMHREHSMSKLIKL